MRTHRSPRQPRAVSDLLVGALLVSLLWDSYRYPLRYDVAGPLTTYRTTPTVLSLGKYVVVMGLLGLAVAMILAAGRRLVVTRSALLLLLAAAVVGAGSAAAGGGAPKLMTPLIVSLSASVLVSVAVHSVPGSGRRLWRAATRIIPLFVVFNTVSNVVQMLLYAAIGRLPFNGYPGSLVRFGGLWDDPNQAAMVSALVIVGAVAISRRTGSKLNRWLMTAALFNVIVSVSYSATVGLVVGLGVVVLLGRHDAAWASPDGRRRRRRQRSAVPLPLVGLGLVVVAFMVLHPDTGVVTRALNGKSKSAHSRLNIIEPADPTSSSAVPNPVDTLGAAVRMSVRGDGRVTSETSSIRVVLGAGLVPLLLLGAWFADTRRRAAPAAPWTIPVTAGLLAGSLFVPDLLVFPLAGLFFAGLEVAAHRQHDSEPTPRR